MLLLLPQLLINTLKLLQRGLQILHDLRPVCCQRGEQIVGVSHSAVDLQRTLRACRLQGGVHLQRDITAADQLAVDVDLREGRPVGKPRQVFEYLREIGELAKLDEK